MQTLNLIDYYNIKINYITGETMMEFYIHDSFRTEVVEAKRMDNTGIICERIESCIKENRPEVIKKLNSFKTPLYRFKERDYRIIFSKIENQIKLLSYVKKDENTYKKDYSSRVFEENKFQKHKKKKIIFSDEQKSTLDKLCRQSKTDFIHFIRGVPGSGKSYLGSKYVIDKILINPEEAFVIILPNSKLRQIYIKELLQSNITVNENDFLFDFKKGSVSIVTLRELYEYEFDNYHENERMRKTLENAIEKERRYSKELCLYSTEFIYSIIQTFFYEPSVVNLKNKKDSLNADYLIVIEKLSKAINKVLENVNKEYLKQSFAAKLMNKLEFGDCKFTQKLELAKTEVSIIIDEIQDLMYEEWMGFVNYVIDRNKKVSSWSTLVCMGDEKQRITLSGFCWALISSTVTEKLKEQGFDKNIIDNQLTYNYRVPKETALLIQEIDKKTEFKGKRKVDSLEVEKCNNNTGYNMLMDFEIDTFFELIELHSELSGTIIIHDSDKLLITRMINLLDSERFTILTVTEAKGTEWNKAILVNPFKYSNFNKVISAEENFKIYTMLTRTTEVNYFLIDSRIEREFLLKSFDSVKKVDKTKFVENISVIDVVDQKRKIRYSIEKKIIRNDKIIDLNLQLLKYIELHELDLNYYWFGDLLELFKENKLLYTRDQCLNSLNIHTSNEFYTLLKVLWLCIHNDYYLAYKEVEHREDKKLLEVLNNYVSTHIFSQFLKDSEHNHSDLHIEVLTNLHKYSQEKIFENYINSKIETIRRELI